MICAQKITSISQRLLVVHRRTGAPLRALANFLLLLLPRCVWFHQPPPEMWRHLPAAANQQRAAVSTCGASRGAGARATQPNPPAQGDALFPPSVEPRYYLVTASSPLLDKWLGTNKWCFVYFYFYFIYFILTNAQSHEKCRPCGAAAVGWCGLAHGAPWLC
jgi:hypothetical protein